MSEKNGGLILDTSGSADCSTLKERLIFFAQKYPNGGIQTFLQGENTQNFLARSVIHPDVANGTRAFTGYAYGTNISAVEEKALLRALTFMGIGTYDTIGEMDGREGEPLPPVASNSTLCEPKTDKEV